MALTRTQKESLIAELSSAVNNSPSTVFLHFKGITVNQNNALRQSMYDADVRFKVAKKTLLNKVLSESSITGTTPVFDGEVALAFGNDLIAPAREAYKFQKENSERFSIVGGIFEGKFMNQSEMTEIATIPDVPVLRGMFVNVINSPIQGFVIALNKIAEKKSA